MKKLIKLLSLMMGLILIVTTVGVAATWQYAGAPAGQGVKSLPLRLFSWVEIPDQEVDIVNKFLNILNKKESCNLNINGVNYRDSFSALIAAFNGSPKAWSGGKYVTLHNNSYIGTMQTKGDDAAALRALFGDSLEAEEASSPDYSLMLKRDALDGNIHSGMSYYMDGDHGWTEENAFYPGCEMVLFSTNWKTDAKTPRGYVIVYATVFTRYPLTDAQGNYIYDFDQYGNIQYYTYQNQYGQTITTDYPIYRYGEWVKISGDEAFAGYAQVVDYSTGDKTRSFATGTWQSASPYYTAPTGSSLGRVIQSIPYLTTN